MSADGVCCWRLWDESLLGSSVQRSMESQRTRKFSEVHLLPGNQKRCLSASLLKTENALSNSPPEEEENSPDILAEQEKEFANNDEALHAFVQDEDKFISVELVNVDLTAELLTQIVEKWQKADCMKRLKSIYLDDNALGEASIVPISNILLNATHLQELSLQNVSMTDSFLSRLICVAAQLKNKSEGNPLKIDISNNGLLTNRGALSLAAGRQFLPAHLTFIDNMQTGEENRSSS